MVDVGMAEDDVSYNMNKALGQAGNTITGKSLQHENNIETVHQQAFYLGKVSLNSL